MPSLKVLPYKESAVTSLSEKIWRRPVFSSVVLGGGTLINSGFIHDFEEIQKKFEITVVAGSGVVDPEFWTTIEKIPDYRPRWVQCLKKCRLVGLRDRQSSLKLEEVGFTDYEIIGDPALSLKPMIKKTQRQKNTIGLCFGESSTKMWCSREHIIDIGCKIVKELEKQNWNCIYFPACPTDERIIREIIHISGCKGEIISNYLNLDAYYIGLSKCHCFMGQKLQVVSSFLCKIFIGQFFEER